MGKHKCIYCGYLAQRIYNGHIPQGFIDLQESARETGALPRRDGLSIFHEGEHMDGDPHPTCFPHPFQLKKEIESRQNADKTAGDTDIVRAVIQTERECVDFTTWQQGLTPKEHREMMDRQWMQRHQDEREDADKKWRSKQDWKLLFVAGLFTLLGSVITWLLTRGGK